MAADSMKKTVGVAFGVSLIASILVASAAVGLKPIQVENKKADLVKNILEVSGFDSNSPKAKEIYKNNIKPEIIELKTGLVLPESEYDSELNPEKFNFKALSESKKYSEQIPTNEDLAGIMKRPKYVVIYKVIENDSLSKYILPIVGKGLWSTLYGFISLNKDLQTVEGITFYEHGETPGLGGEIENPRWRSIWTGKQLFDSTGVEKLRVIKGKVSNEDSGAKYKVDGLAGATLTTNGVDRTIRYWFGENGYAPLLKKLRGEN